MEKSYVDFMNEISSEDLYDGLLGYGMFAEKLPPVFQSLDFLNYCKLNLPSYKYKQWTDYVSYNSMRNVNIPRTYGIPVPMTYEVLCSHLRDKWECIRKHFESQTDKQEHRVSRIHLRKQYEKSVLFEMNYKNWKVDGTPNIDYLLVGSRDAVSRYLVKADISTCFPSIYTHAISWALVGKSESKKNVGVETWYNIIDNQCASLKNGETHGLLIGPHASNLLAEIILTKVDSELYDLGYRFNRYIDDYECFVRSYEDALQFERDLGFALRKYDLSINCKKTQILKLPLIDNNLWVNELTDMMPNKDSLLSYNETNRYLDKVISMANEVQNAAVINYAIKCLAGIAMTASANTLYLQRISHLVVLCPYLLPLMDDYVFQPRDATVIQIQAFSEALYEESKSINNYECVS